MGKVEIRIPHVTWRDGRPRFIPGTVLRREGFRGRDLRHGEGGAWFTLDEAIAWSQQLATELATRREERASGKRVRRPQPMAGALTVGELIERMFALPTFQPIEDPRERAEKEAISPKTISWYKGIAAVLEQYDPQLWNSPVTAVSRLAAKGFRRKAVADKGLTMTRAFVAVLRRAFGEIDHVVLVNPFARLKLKSAKPRVRAGEPESIDRLIAVADHMERFDIGDAIMLGVTTGQRQNDRIALTEQARVDGALLFRQLKTGAVVTLPPLPRLVQRLDAAKERRALHDSIERAAGRAEVKWPHVVIDEPHHRPWHPEGGHYRRTFAKVRAVAIAGIVDAEATATARAEHAAAGRNEEPPTVWLVPPSPELEGFHDQDFRDTAVTWLARAGCTVPEICAITGHSEQTAYTILKHYLGRHPELAVNALAKLAAWLAAKDAATPTTAAAQR
jgi:hypothetical protein